MKIFIVIRNDKVDYDQFDAAVVIAETGAQALRLLKKQHGAESYNGWGNYDVMIREIDVEGGEPEIVLESFRAG